MAEYIGIKGSTIQSLSSDPPAPVEGQVWYNTTSTVLKGYKKTYGTGAWASGGDMTRSAPNAFDCGSLGTQTAALAIGTQTPAYPGILTEEYNGSSWSPVNSLNTGRGYSAGFGTTTAGIYSGGSPTSVAAALTESWNGSAWTEVNNNPVGTYAQARGGTSTAGIQMGGGHWPESPAWIQTESCEWDGTCWATTGSVNVGRVYTCGGGIQTSAFFAGGDTATPKSNLVETYDGSSWSTSPATLNTPRGAIMGSGTSAENGLVYGGSTPSVTNIAESFNGTTMTEVADMAYNRQEGGFGPSGSNTACLAISTANATPGAAGKTEEWTVPAPLEIKTFTAS